MRPISLKVRTFAAALIALLFFIPLMNYALQQAYAASIHQATFERLRLLSLTLISEFEIEGKEVYMPELMIHGEFNLPDSGIYAVIHNYDIVVWKSMSAINWQWPEINTFPVPGKSRFETLPDNQGDKYYFRYSYTAEFETDLGLSPVAFHVFMDKSAYDNEIAQFESTLLNWLAIIAALLLLLLLFTLNTALNPINRLEKEISSIKKGSNRRIASHYPPELETLKNSLNHLLSTEENQRERYKNSLGDLAHSLKTPLAVLSGMKSLPEEGREPVFQIDQIIQRQLKRAVAGAGSRWNQNTQVTSAVNKLTDAMEKVYADKFIAIEHDIEPDTEFQGDATDLMELLGNLMDNACKAAKSRVLVEVHQAEKFIEISISDDGPGIPEDKKHLLLERGQRLDSYESGQGIGMAVVSDLTAAYQGQLEISQSELGGAKVSVKFPV
ncbi:ATP-binding protein [Planctobacterium marinum]|uniref:histidine kinase n=1 Tax=Planctobacterium marinum TaxID=1631968 RepID=A0AA48HJL8_9ALTE|nr:two-component sensor histidine kinase [Planctobacterium marinum]